jgi:hypothetical protein
LDSKIRKILKRCFNEESSRISPKRKEIPEGLEET